MKVLIVEDDNEIVEFISLAFETGWPGAEMVTTHHGSHAVELVESESPDIVILDLGLPDIDGFDVLKQIRLFSTVPIIITTVRDSEADIVKGLEWGAEEYVPKPFGQLELLARVRTVLRSRRSSESTDTIVIYGPLRLNGPSGQLIYASNKIQLTRTESLILHLLIKNTSQVVTFLEIAETIWGDAYPNAADTLRVYISRLRVKLSTIAQQKVSIKSRPGVGYFLE